MNVLKIIRTAYKIGRITFKKRILMEFLVAGNFTSRMKSQEGINLAENDLKLKRIERDLIIADKLLAFIGTVILICAPIGLVMLIIL